MNLSLYKLRKQLKKDKSGQASMIAVVIAGVVGTILVSSITAWYLSMRANLGNTEDKLEAQTIAQSEWERLSHMSLDELEASRSILANPYSAGTGSHYQISVNLGQKGTFNNGTCGAIGSDGYADCFKDTTITVYHDGTRMFTTRTLPLMAGNYTRKEIDNLLADMRNDYTTKINNLTNRLNNDYYTKSQVDSKISNFIRLEDVDKSATLPAGKALYVYLNGQKLPLVPDGGYVEVPSTSPTGSIRQNSSTILSHTGNYRVLSWDDGATFDMTLQNDTYLSVSYRGTDHFHAWYQKPGEGAYGVPNGILLMPKGTYLHWQDTDFLIYLTMKKYYVKYD